MSWTHFKLSALIPPDQEALLDRLMLFFAFLIGFFPPLSNSATYIASGGFALFWVLQILTQKKRWRPSPTPLDQPIVFFMAIWLFSALLSTHPLKSLGTLPSQMHFFVFYLLVYACGGRYIPTAFRGYLAGAGVAVLYGLSQWVFLFWICKSGYPDWFYHLSEKTQSYIGLTGDNRIHGAVNPLTYAETILPFFFFSTASWLESKGVAQHILWLSASFLAGAALLCAHTRGPWIAALAGVGVMGLLHRRRLLLILPLILLIPITTYNVAARRNVMSFLELDTNRNVQARMALWRGGIYIARRHLLHGVGPGQTKAADEQYKVRPDYTPNPPNLAGDLHNLFLQHLAERGIPGMACILWILISFILISWRAYKWGPTGISLGLLASFITFPIINLTERAFEDAEVALAFWILTAVAVRLSQKESAKTFN
ncbi:MAG: O-antigen ligase family protein [Elusimicrobia bacterium]|nr:O-antigen ligase family protein [Elusimicrobiota bacterium]